MDDEQIERLIDETEAMLEELQVSLRKTVTLMSTFEQRLSELNALRGR